MAEALICPREASQEQNPGYAVIRQEDAQAFSRQVRELTAALLMLQREVEAMKRDNAQRVTVNHQQARAVISRIRERAEALCDKYSLDPKRHGAAFRAAIKRDILDGCGVKDPHDIPLRELELITQRIDGWTSYALVRKRRNMDGHFD